VRVRSGSRGGTSAVSSRKTTPGVAASGEHKTDAAGNGSKRSGGGGGKKRKRDASAVGVKLEGRDGKEGVLLKKEGGGAMDDLERRREARHEKKRRKEELKQEVKRQRSIKRLKRHFTAKFQGEGLDIGAILAGAPAEGEQRYARQNNTVDLSLFPVLDASVRLLKPLPCPFDCISFDGRFTLSVLAMTGKRDTPTLCRFARVPKEDADILIGPLGMKDPREAYLSPSLGAAAKRSYLKSTSTCALRRPLVSAIPLPTLNVLPLRNLSMCFLCGVRRWVVHILGGDYTRGAYISGGIRSISGTKWRSRVRHPAWHGVQHGGDRPNVRTGSQIPPVHKRTYIKDVFPTRQLHGIPLEPRSVARLARLVCPSHPKHCQPKPNTINALPRRRCHLDPPPRFQLFSSYVLPHRLLV
jgi:hypothetical protein